MYYEARYQPQETEKLSKKAALFVGKMIAIQDGGQEELKPGKKTVVYIASPNFGLIPNSDLVNITSVPFSKWTALNEANKLLVEQQL
ncbi:conserved hypothetical protein [Desulfamplus magnetovallimortis]|uniref:Uncharacterized protein n=1 Tax=Desulfamplus magnetovallimortis TaxID=1246637 RepID=A0A1W1HKY9_9BACT|nr:hypothetical protein [Desulfamplus magnetovallimortis]SLM33130.1 conserved hypothetical protein [Desulfamplus magnetovallimortis]